MYVCKYLYVDLCMDGWMDGVKGEAFGSRSTFRSCEKEENYVFVC